MARRTGKSVNFDVMVKFFLQHYNIPTKRDIDKVLNRLDRLEKTLKPAKTGTPGRRGRPPKKGRTAGALGTRAATGITATDAVINVIRASGADGVSFGVIKEKTGFDDKKLRNIIFRLNKIGKITRRKRGVYTGS